MAYLQLFVIQLIPDFLWIAGAVVIIHWIWLFGFKKGVRVRVGALKMSGATQTLDIIPASSVGEFGAEITHPSSPDETSPVQLAPPPPLTAESLETKPENGSSAALENSLSRIHPLVEKYAGFSILPHVHALQHHQLDATALAELDELALLTQLTKQQAAPLEALPGWLPTSLDFIA